MDIIQETWTTTHPIYPNIVPLPLVPIPIPGSIFISPPPAMIHPVVHPAPILNPIPILQPAPIIAPVPVIQPAPILHVATPMLSQIQGVRTIWIVSSSLPRLNGPPFDAIARAQMEQSSPINIPPSFTLHCETWSVPPLEMQSRFSGVSKQMQAWVRANVPSARADIQNVVNLIVRQWYSSGDDIVVHTCCMRGTHRSVAAAEMIGKKVKREMQRRGEIIVAVVVNHPHRERKPLDPY